MTEGGSAPGTATPAGPPPASPQVFSRPWARPAAIFVLLSAIYLCDGGFLPVGDATANLYLPVCLLTRGCLSVTPEDAPFMFLWEFRLFGTTKSGLSLESWNDEIAGRKAAELYKEGALVASKPRYYLVPTVKAGRFVGIYGPGAGLAATPYFALLALVHGGWRESTGMLAAEAKFFAVACVAGSAVLVYLSLLPFVPATVAFILSLLYGLGTCVWTEPTQALWQQTPTLLFMALGGYFLSRTKEARLDVFGCGLAFALATLCRPTAGLLLVVVGGSFLILKKWRSAACFALGAAAPVAVLLAFGLFQFGSPFQFGQVQAVRSLGASAGDGTTAGTPFLARAAGLLISPSRGLLVFSPFLALSFWGAVEAWRRPEFHRLRSLGVGVAVALVLAAKWPLWHGGVCFGYRLLVEWTPVLVLLIAPVAGRVLSSAGPRAAVGVLAAWSVLVQALGAFAYDPLSWNARPGFEIQMRQETGTRVLLHEAEANRLIEAGEARPIRLVSMDVAQPRFEGRLWSLGDSQIGYLMSELPFRSAKEARKKLIARAYRDKFGGLSD